MTPPQQMQQGTNPLDSLEPNILPDPIGFWPPAIGWWVLALLIVLVITGTGIAFWRWYKRNAYRREALKKLDAIQQGFEHHQDQLKLVKQYNHLLKAVALSAFPREQVAALNSAAWLKFLDKNLKQSTTFRKGAGKALGQVYSTAVSVDSEKLHNSVKLWVRKHKTPKSKNIRSTAKEGLPHA
ncbi:DUF4381 domain-containing protein [Parendozoicomonas sp. Alg238-R29]|uniref:DUF4381 domain-containing protein n=1 Tax=Parendozoicomonas sp. Alg238-R29 TaxID=2993446 RepID=UPI00248D8885|nr:DUF4381 domain-containing protein [Parendozoicomonas sp. Alg238-R29]